MENQKSFLEIWKEVIYRLRDEGLVTQEDIDNGFGIPMEWLYSSGIERDDLILSIRNLYHKEHPNNIYLINRFKRLANLVYSEIDGKPSIEVLAGKSSVFITDEQMASKGWKRNATSKDLMDEIIYAKKQRKTNKLIAECGLTREQATSAIKEIFNDKQVQSDLYAMPHVLSEMAVNFGEYFKHIQQEKQEAEKFQETEEKTELENDGPIETKGGIIEQIVDERETTRIDRDGIAIDRKSEIYPFEQRDAIFRNLKPIRIVKYDGLDRNHQVVENAYTLYIYINPQEHNGYLGISEHIDGNRETRAFYMMENDIEGLKENEDIEKFWHTIGEIYISMSRNEFTKEEGTYRFRHTGDIEDFRQKIEGVVKGVSKENLQTVNVKRASLALFNKNQLKENLKGVTQTRYDKAKEIVFGERETTQTKEGEDITNDK